MLRKINKKEENLHRIQNEKEEKFKEKSNDERMKIVDKK